VTIGGAVERPGIYEIEVGLPLDELVRMAGGESKPLSAFLVGGYFGGWVFADDARAVALAPPELGAGVVARARDVRRGSQRARRTLPRR